MFKRSLIPLTLLASLLFASQEPLQVPPGDIPVEHAPMFISLGFDDNSHSGMPNSTAPTGGVKWVVDFTDTLTNPAGTGNAATFDGAPVLCSFYSNSYYMMPYNGDYASLVKWTHNYAYRKGHEVSNHTHSHLTSGNGPELDAAAWEAELNLCNDWLTKPAPTDSTSLSHDDNRGAGIAIEDIVGFRSPYLRYGNGTFEALKKLNFQYDCSIEEGLDPSQDGTNFYWPYTLDHESPGHNYMVETAGTKKAEYFKPEHGELWELPCYALVAPTDDLCEQYGIEPGFRQRLDDYFTTLGKPGSFDAANGKITGLDYNLYYFQEYNLNKAEALGVLKYTLDLRMQGNRAPFLLGVHSQYYNDVWNSNSPNIASSADRRAVLEEFVSYALETYPDVRVTTMKNVMEWCRNPVALRSGGTATSAKAVAKKQQLAIQGNRVRLNSNRPITMELFSLSGQKIASKEVGSFNGICQWRVNQGIAKGTYIVRAGELSAKLQLK